MHAREWSKAIEQRRGSWLLIKIEVHEREMKSCWFREAAEFLTGQESGERMGGRHVQFQGKSSSIQQLGSKRKSLLDFTGRRLGKYIQKSSEQGPRRNYW